jgi:hypothetical protein
MDKVGEQIPAVAITAASLTLVFLGLLFTSWDSYDAAAKPSVKRRFRRRVWTGFFGFLTSTISVVFGFIGIGTATSWPVVVGLIFLGIWAILTIGLAFIAALEIE